MSTSLQISIDSRAAEAQLAAIRGALDARTAINRVSAAAGAVTVRGWLLRRNDRSVRSNYWSNAAEATSGESDADSARIVIRHPGVGWHRFGGTIYAKPGKAMAIPLRDAVAGMWPSEFFQGHPGAAFVWRKGGHAFLAMRDGAALRILYLLVKSVSKSEDPSVLPSPAEIAASVSEAVTDLVRLAIARRRAPGA